MRPGIRAERGENERVASGCKAPARRERSVVLAVARYIGSSRRCVAFRIYSQENRKKIGGRIPNRSKAFVSRICARVPPSEGESPGLWSQSARSVYTHCVTLGQAPKGTNLQCDTFSEHLAGPHPLQAFPDILPHTTTPPPKKWTRFF